MPGCNMLQQAVFADPLWAAVRVPPFNVIILALANRMLALIAYMFFSAAPLRVRVKALLNVPIALSRLETKLPMSAPGHFSMATEAHRFQIAYGMVLGNGFRILVMDVQIGVPSAMDTFAPVPFQHVFATQIPVRRHLFPTHLPVEIKFEEMPYSRLLFGIKFPLSNPKLPFGFGAPSFPLLVLDSPPFRLLFGLLPETLPA